MDFIYSYEWLEPINTFIEEYCLIFSGNDDDKWSVENSKGFKQYRKMVGSTLDTFLKDVLGMQRKDLAALCKHNTDKLEYNDMVHFLALEDYNLFLKIMCLEEEDRVMSRS